MTYRVAAVLLRWWVDYNWLSEQVKTAQNRLSSPTCSDDILMRSKQSTWRRTKFIVSDKSLNYSRMTTIKWYCWYHLHNHRQHWHCLHGAVEPTQWHNALRGFRANKLLQTDHQHDAVKRNERKWRSSCQYFCYQSIILSAKSWLDRQIDRQLDGYEAVLTLR